jgi:hypothetical protein
MNRSVFDLTGKAVMEFGGSRVLARAQSNGDRIIHIKPISGLFLTLQF